MEQTPKDRQDRLRTHVGYSIGVIIESAAVCVIMAVALAVAYAIVSWYR